MNSNVTDNCKGLFFRYSESMFIGKQGDINYKKTMRPLKRISCDGNCKRPHRGICDTHWMPEDLHEHVHNGLVVDVPDDAKDGDTLQLCANISGGSYEYPDEVDVELYFKVVNNVS